MPQISLKLAQTEVHHVGSAIWVPEKGVADAAGIKQKAARWVKGRVVAVGKNAAKETVLTVQTEEGATHELKPADCPLQNERDDTVDDLVKSDFLHEPG